MIAALIRIVDLLSAASPACPAKFWGAVVECLSHNAGFESGGGSSWIVVRGSWFVGHEFVLTIGIARESAVATKKEHDSATYNDTSDAPQNSYRRSSSTYWDGVWMLSTNRQCHEVQSSKRNGFSNFFLKTHNDTLRSVLAPVWRASKRRSCSEPVACTRRPDPEIQDDGLRDELITSSQPNHSLNFLACPITLKSGVLADRKPQLSNSSETTPAEQKRERWVVKHLSSLQIKIFD